MLYFVQNFVFADFTPEFYIVHNLLECESIEENFREDAFTVS